MRRLWIVVVALVTVGVGGVAWSARPAESAAAGTVRVQRWQYATLITGKGVTALSLPDQKVDGDSGFEIFQKLGGKGESRQFDNNDLLNLLGQQGWELAAAVQSGTATIHYLKRPAVRP